MTAKKVFRWCLVICWLALTIFLSRQKGGSSAALSGTIASGLRSFLTRLGINVQYYSFHASLRQLAHFAMHFVLAILFYRAMHISCGGFRAGICISLFFCALVAIYDELVQYYRPGRVLDINDIVLNLFGVSFGILVGILTVRQKD